MSEYQYYEFQAIDRPLTPDEQRTVARLSSRVEPHPRRAVFTYNWSDFPGNPKEVLARYYDAMFDVANWGSTQLLFRFPRAALDLEGVQAYCQPPIVEDYLAFRDRRVRSAQHRVPRGRVGGDWVEGEGWLDTLLPLRDDILRGDYRALYLAWLKAVSWEDELKSVVEPPVPPGLNKLTPALESLIEVFEVDKTLLQVAAEVSPERATAEDEWQRAAIGQLSREECDAFLLRLAQGEPHLGLALKTRLRALAGRPEAQAPDASRRTVGQLLGEAERRRELAEYKGRAAEFQERMLGIRELYSRRPAFIGRLDQARL